MKKIVLIIGLLLSWNINAGNVWDKTTQKLEQPVEIIVYRSPTCGCCGKWLSHLEKHQFKVQDVITRDMDGIKQKYAVPNHLASCHTAIVNGYVIEGHVPAADIITLLKNKPNIMGLTVPGMTTGTPGMEMGGKKDPFKVIAFDKDGQLKLFNNYERY